ncbi:hypothetical protein G6F68_018759 [Rhizopus microsporus]|nr:hypothetical protein G6F68_018759 [Rhizopus microsporus]
MRENKAVAVHGFIRKLRDQRQRQLFAIALGDLHRNAVQHVEAGFERVRMKEFQLARIEFHQPRYIAGQPGRHALDQAARAFAPARMMAQHQEEAFGDRPQFEIAGQVTG